MSEESEKAKAKRPTPLKRDIQNRKRQLINRILKSRIGTAARNFKKSSTPENWRTLQALLDKGAKKSLFKQNKVDRMKSNLSSWM